jgi:hypothetical protein
MRAILLLTSALFLFIVSIVFAETCNGQNKIDGYLINPKIGYSTRADFVAHLYGIEAGILKNKFLFTAGYYYSIEAPPHFFEPLEYDNQIGLLFGRYAGERFLRFEYQAGLAAKWGMERTDYTSTGFMTGYWNTERYSKIGISLKLGFRVIPTNYLSLGLDLQTNLYPGKSLFMPMAGIAFGKFVKKE